MVTRVSLHCIRQIKIRTIIGINRIINNPLFPPRLKSSFSIKVFVTYVQLLSIGVQGWRSCPTMQGTLYVLPKWNVQCGNGPPCCNKWKLRPRLNELLSSTAIATLLVFLRNYTIKWCDRVSKGRWLGTPHLWWHQFAVDIFIRSHVDRGVLVSGQRAERWQQLLHIIAVLYRHWWQTCLTRSAL